jgi:hypothetical protein
MALFLTKPSLALAHLVGIGKIVTNAVSEAGLGEELAPGRESPARGVLLSAN